MRKVYVTARRCLSWAGTLLGDDVDRKTREAGAILLYGTLKNVHEPYLLSNKFYISEDSIISIVDNLTKYKVWKDGKTYSEYDWFDGSLEGLIEFSMVVGLVIGKLKREEVSKVPKLLEVSSPFIYGVVPVKILRESE